MTDPAREAFEVWRKATVIIPNVHLTPTQNWEWREWYHFRAGWRAAIELAVEICRDNAMAMPDEKSFKAVAQCKHDIAALTQWQAEGGQ